MRETVLRELLALAFGKRKRYRVQGESMLPVLAPDDVVLVCPTRTCEIGDIVVAKHPYQEITVIKYVTEIDDNGFLELTSPGGTDSRKFGRPPSKNILGVVTFNLTKKSFIINDEIVL